ncbi:MAG: glycosyltransferase [Acutalibacteraceae bacterium]|nr:glycosyltransferase [Acutalibacteraceae bacterium]
MKDSVPAISVIIPIYNVGEYLSRCLSSVSYQSFKDFEVIMVDDSSTDNSPQIATEFETKFSNFRLVHNPSKGVSSARNLGVSLARGEYIAFVDSDDYIDVNYLKSLYTVAKENNADVVHCNYGLYYIESGLVRPVIIRKPRTKIMSNLEMAEHTIADFCMRSYLWNKLWKKSLFIDNNITFPEMKFEDIATTSRLLYFANKGVVINKVLYYYTIRRGSIVQTPSIKNSSDYLLSFGHLKRFFIDQNCYKQLRASFFQLGLAMYFGNAYFILKFHLKKKSFKYFFKNIDMSRKNLCYFCSDEFKKQVGKPPKELKYNFTIPDEKE